jgi:8-oxo-dGTP diphosphatase
MALRYAGARDCDSPLPGVSPWWYHHSVAEIRAAGGVVVRGDEVLLVHRPRYDDWSLPKGKLDDGESFEEAALREVLEETGYTCVLGEPLGSTHYESRGRPKEVRWFAMEAKGDPVEHDDEVDEVRWVTGAEALELLTYDRDRTLLSRLR